MFSKNSAFCEIMCKNIVKPGPTDDNTIWRIRFVCCITKATHTHTQYVIPVDFPRQQCLRERALVSRYVCIAYLVEKSDAYITTDGFNDELI
jgi:hypothetical protein